MATTTHSEREALAACRAALRRLDGPQAPIPTGQLERLQFMRRHMAEIERDVRYDLRPAPTHLTSLAAHCLLLYMERDEI